MASATKLTSMSNRKRKYINESENREIVGKKEIVLGKYLHCFGHNIIESSTTTTYDNNSELILDKHYQYLQEKTKYHLGNSSDIQETNWQY